MNGEELHIYIWSEFDSETVELINLSKGHVAVYLQSCFTRGTSPNEDAACVIELDEDRVLLAVADGVGGGAAGKDAARLAVESLAEACFELELKAVHVHRGVRCEILDAIECANYEILKWGIGAATTLTAIELAGDQFRYFHVGDSGGLLTSNRGTIKFATVGHAPVAQAVAIGMLDSEEALAHSDQNVITNCIGIAEMKTEIGIFRKISRRDTLLLASDGLFDNLTSQEIAEIICKGDLVNQSEQLVVAARERMRSENGKPDDLTVICYRQTNQ